MFDDGAAVIRPVRVLARLTNVTVCDCHCPRTKQLAKAFSIAIHQTVDERLPFDRIIWLDLEKTLIVECFADLEPPSFRGRGQFRELKQDMQHGRIDTG